MHAMPPRAPAPNNIEPSALPSCGGNTTPNQTGKRSSVTNSPLHSRPFICYKQFTESRCVAKPVVFVNLSV